MPARHGAHANHSSMKAGTSFLLPILKGLGYYVASFGKVGNGGDSLTGVDYDSRAARGMSGRVVKHFAGQQIDGPICLLVGDRRPHAFWSKKSIYDPDEITLPPYLIDTPETREHWARYITDITGMDEELGRILEFSKERFWDDFIFLFTSDHGGQWHKGKWTLYDSGARIPLIVRWPDRIKAGVRTEAMVSWVDLIPTLIDLAGGKVPDDIDGRSFGRVLLGESGKHRDKIFTTHTGDNAMNIFPVRSVRIGRYKFIHNLRPDAWFTNHPDRLRQDGSAGFWDSWDEAAKKDPKAAEILRRYYTRPEFELFDLNADPLEESNLAYDAKHSKRLKEMRAALVEWAKSQGDDLQPHREPYPRSQTIPEVADPALTRRKAK